VICAEAAGLLAGAADAQLGADEDRAVRLHAAGCLACAAELAGLHSLRRDLRAAAPYHAAPASLRARVLALAATSAKPHEEAAHRSPDVHPQARPTLRASAALHDRWRWLAGGAFAGALATAIVWLAVSSALGWRTRNDVANEAVASHVRATLGNHLVEVVSSDRHTVKPWLSARLDYAPPVVDLREEGFLLAGARIDYLGGRPVATLVYRYRAHVIDVFVQPRDEAGAGNGLRNVRGYTVASATGPQMQWRAVADVQADVLAGFVARLVTNDPAAR